MLTSSVIEKVNEEESSMELTKRMLKKYSGAWIGDESSEEIISAIRENSSIRKAVEL